MKKEDIFDVIKRKCPLSMEERDLINELAAFFYIKKISPVKSNINFSNIISFFKWRYRTQIFKNSFSLADCYRHLNWIIYKCSLKDIIPHDLNWYIIADVVNDLIDLEYNYGDNVSSILTFNYD